MKTIYISAFVACVLLFSSCDKFLDRPPLTTIDDNTNAWVSEDNVRLYASKYYTDFFTGYGIGFNTEGATYLAYKHSDDIVRLGNQTTFLRAVPNAALWDMRNIRSTNIMIDRIQTRMKSILSTEAQAHWLGIGRFFRAMQYHELVMRYGDVPYYDFVVSDLDNNALYKARTPRNEVMDALYEDWKYAMANVRVSDGEQNVNRYVVAAFVSRMAMQEGSWQKYYYKNNERAKKFFNLAVEASAMVMSSGRYDINTDYRSLFTSKDLKGNKEMVMYRVYDAAVSVMHSVASNSNFESSTNDGPSAELMKAYLCTDGDVYQFSTLADARKFDLTSMIKTRDSRFEATFYRLPDAMNRGALVYINKFLPRDIEARIKSGGGVPAEFVGDKNDTDAPVFRYAEVLLNNIEAKAELETLGAGAVGQADIENTINKIRKRPIAAEAVGRGVKQTASLLLGSLPNDPSRDFTVSPLLWEIRRERRVEFTFEYSRIADLKRWSKLEYMDTDKNPSLLAGGWVNSAEIPTQARVAGQLSVVGLDGKVTVYNGSNLGDMNGFYRSTTNSGRLPFVNQVNINPYLDPVGRTNVEFYRDRGYELKQTAGWPQN
ncbi:RagB/SusD family nutrient uptake outer membrane protein [Sphingobacterium sp. MYb382]|uniref:RagB/SusD family nutrient uptake outer membrane protein n=1 Tax=Sphingobacterium sp. MYb382 TaxID=2745278 RepID=UPI0030A1A839